MCLLPIITYAQPSWTYTKTGSNHTILVQSGKVTTNGDAVSVGDYIVVFFHDGSNMPIYICFI